MDGIVVFADENSILRTELFDEAQKVTTVGAVPGILGEEDSTSKSFLLYEACLEERFALSQKRGLLKRFRQEMESRL